MKLHLPLALAAVILVAGVAGLIAFRTHRPNLAQPSGTVGPETGSAPGASMEQLRAAATAKERASVTHFKNQAISDLYLRGYSLTRHRTSTKAHLAELTSVISHAPETVQSTDPNETLLHPIHAGFALATLAKAWYIQGPLDLDHEQLALDAVRLSRFPDEVVRLECAMILRVMKDHPAKTPLPEAAERRLAELLRNEFIASALPVQLEDMARTAEGLK